jgi:hypothetical protein
LEGGCMPEFVHVLSFAFIFEVCCIYDRLVYTVVYACYRSVPLLSGEHGKNW